MNYMKDPFCRAIATVTESCEFTISERNISVIRIPMSLLQDNNVQKRVQLRENKAM